MAQQDDIGAAVVLAFGAAVLWMVNRPKSPPKRKDRDGEACDPLDDPPDGYICVAEDGGFVYRKEAVKFLGFGPYPNRAAVDNVLERLSMQDLAEFQTFMSQTTRWNLRSDGVVDSNTMRALKEAEELFEAGKWHV